MSRRIRRMGKIMKGMGRKGSDCERMRKILSI